MKKKLIYVACLNQGDILSEDIMSPYGGMLVTENTVMNTSIKDKLLELGIKRVKIYAPEKQNEAEKFFDEVSETYLDDIDLVKGIFVDLTSGKKINLEKLNAVTDSLYEQISRESFIVHCIEKLKNADEYTYMHSVNVSLYAMMIAKWLKLPKAKIKEIVQAGLMHDIGKVEIPTDLLNKSSRLLPGEYDQLKKHSTYGYDIICSLDDVSETVKLGILMHHERENGSGYPLGVKGRSINLCSKIIAIADVFDAMTSDRVYKKRTSPFDAFKEFQLHMMDLFDTKTILVFLKNIAIYYVGLNVLMNDGSIGEVIYINPQDISSPMVRINAEIIDLSTEKELKILSIA